MLLLISLDIFTEVKFFLTCIIKLIISIKPDSTDIENINDAIVSFFFFYSIGERIVFINREKKKIKINSVGKRKK